MTVVVGLVVEGKHDADAMENMTTAELKRLGYDDIIFRQLQPEQDASGTINSGGWTNVVGWLIRNSGDGIETYFAPLFDNVVGCDIIVVHIDADIRVQCLAQANRDLPTHDKPSLVVQAMREALIQWLAVAPERRLKIPFAIPVFMTENWLMGSRPELPDSHWVREDAKDAFREARELLNFRSLMAMRQHFVAGFGNNLSTITSRSTSYRLFVEELQSSLA